MEKKPALLRVRQVAGERTRAPCLVSAPRLNLDHVRAHVGEQAGTEGRGDSAAEFYDPQAGGLPELHALHSPQLSLLTG